MAPPVPSHSCCKLWFTSVPLQVLCFIHNVCDFCEFYSAIISHVLLLLQCVSNHEKICQQQLPGKHQHGLVWSARCDKGNPYRKVCKLSLGYNTFVLPDCYLQWQHKGFALANWQAMVMKYTLLCLPCFHCASQLPCFTLPHSAVFSS